MLEGKFRFKGVRGVRPIEFPSNAPKTPFKLPSKTSTPAVSSETAGVFLIRRYTGTLVPVYGRA
jgi:hypothetical protein